MDQTEECLKRIEQRKRVGEEKITIHYLEMLDNYHELFKKYLLDAGQNVISGYGFINIIEVKSVYF